MLRASRVVQGVPQARAFRLSPHGAYPTLLLLTVARACAASFLYLHPSPPLPSPVTVSPRARTISYRDCVARGAHPSPSRRPACL